MIKHWIWPNKQNVWLSVWDKNILTKSEEFATLPNLRQMLSNWILDFPVTEEENLHSNCPYIHFQSIEICNMKWIRFCIVFWKNHGKLSATIRWCNGHGKFKLQTWFAISSASAPYKYHFELSIHYVPSHFCFRKPGNFVNMDLFLWTLKSEFCAFDSSTKCQCWQWCWCNGSAR